MPKFDIATVCWGIGALFFITLIFVMNAYQYEMQAIAWKINEYLLTLN